jgi:GntR family transcriptional regulator, carbon starvation induced regulator
LKNGLLGNVWFWRILLQKSSDETRTLTESAYRHIRSDILSGSIAPENRLQIVDLSQRHGTSASAVREALSRLVSERLVTLEEQKGFRAASASEG